MVSKAILALVAALCLRAQPTIYIAGDSTAKNGTGRGWGDPFASYFDPAKAKMENRARGGRSSRTFLTEGLWGGIVADLQPGDLLKSERTRYAGLSRDRQGAECPE
jgi:hypothetical protein